MLLRLTVSEIQPIKVCQIISIIFLQWIFLCWKWSHGHPHGFWVEIWFYLMDIGQKSKTWCGSYAEIFMWLYFKSNLHQISTWPCSFCHVSYTVLGQMGGQPPPTPVFDLGGFCLGGVLGCFSGPIWPWPSFSRSPKISSLLQNNIISPISLDPGLYLKQPGRQGRSKFFGADLTLT